MQSCSYNYKFIETTFRPLVKYIINVCIRFFFLFLTRSYANYLQPVLPVSLHTQLTLLSIKCKYCGSFNLRPYTYMYTHTYCKLLSLLCCGSLELINYSINAINMHCWLIEFAACKNSWIFKCWNSSFLFFSKRGSSAEGLGKFGKRDASWQWLKEICQELA